MKKEEKQLLQKPVYIEPFGEKNGWWNKKGKLWVRRGIFFLHLTNIHG